MLEFIVTHWLGTLLSFLGTLVTGALSAGIAYLKKQLKIARETKKKEEFQRVENLIESIDKNNATRMSELEKKFNEANARQDAEMAVIKQGLLASWKRTFMATGRLLLSKEHYITEQEFESFVKDHNTYNLLGGNHEGDELFENVKIKYRSGLHN